MGKPILHTAEDAILMFYTTGLDVLVVEDWIIVKYRRSAGRIGAQDLDDASA